MSSTAGHLARRAPPYTLAILLILTFGVLAAKPRDGRPSPSVECRASFDPGRVVITEIPISVNARFSEPLGTIDEIDAEAGSGIEPLEYDGDAAVLTIDTSGGSTGTWSIEFIDEIGVECVGTLALAQAERD